MKKQTTEEKRLARLAAVNARLAVHRDISLACAECGTTVQCTAATTPALNLAVP